MKNKKSIDSLMQSLKNQMTETRVSSKGESIQYWCGAKVAGGYADMGDNYPTGSNANPKDSLDYKDKAE